MLFLYPPRVGLGERDLGMGTQIWNIGKERGAWGQKVGHGDIWGIGTKWVGMGRQKVGHGIYAVGYGDSKWA